ncbi:MAG: hypothetical protein OXG23_13145 [Chloroflexi bacterium]|nr:hypothetical protein [Chloroflexota bacterium]
MLADVWDPSAMWWLAFFCHDSSAENIRASNDERVCACANDTLLPSHDLLKMLNLEDISDGSRLFANQWRE